MGSELVVLTWCEEVNSIGVSPQKVSLAHLKQQKYFLFLNCGKLGALFELRIVDFCGFRSCKFYSSLAKFQLN